MEHEEQHTTASPLFVGGTGRCGTHAIASLVDRSSRFVAAPAELRLHVDPDGLPGFADGTLSRRQVVRALRTQWWRHTPAWDPSADRGVHRIAPLHRYAAALVELTATPSGDRLAISRRFVSRLLDPLAPAPGAWIEKSPDNCAAAGFLLRLFPRLRLIHVIRDGRDVACSFMRVPWAPDVFAEALELWERRLLDAHQGTLQVPQRQAHRVLLEDLVAFDRDRSCQALLDFLPIHDGSAVRSFFDRELTPARASIGRWRSDLHPSEHARANSLYRDSLKRLEAAGVDPLPPLDQPVCAGERSPSPIDPWSAPVPSF